MYTIHTTPHVKCWRTVFTHWLFLYQKSHSFAALTRSISDTKTTRVQIPYVSTFHEVFSINFTVYILLRLDWTKEQTRLFHSHPQLMSLQTDALKR